MFIMCLISIFFCVVVCMRIYNLEIVPMKQENEKAKTKDYVTYDEKSLTLTVLSRNPIISEVVKIEDAKNLQIRYKPEKLHIGAASGGGVTVGGTYTTGGYNYVSGISKSGKYCLEYAGQIVKHVQLNSEMFLKAQQSPIAPYLDKATQQIQVVEPVQYTETERMFLANNLNNAAGQNMLYNDKRGYPSYDKCVAILNWICEIS